MALACRFPDIKPEKKDKMKVYIIIRVKKMKRENIFIEEEKEKTGNKREKGG